MQSLELTGTGTGTAVWFAVVTTGQLTRWVIVGEPCSE